MSKREHRQGTPYQQSRTVTCARTYHSLHMTSDTATRLLTGRWREFGGRPAWLKGYLYASAALRRLNDQGHAVYFTGD
jgi:hypothetical protein